jgi:hypothetical protein
MLVARQEQGARNLLERRQRRVAFERVGERRGARVADLVVPQAAARRGWLGCSNWPPMQSRARATYSRVVSRLNPFASLSLFIPLLSSLRTSVSAFIFATLLERKLLSTATLLRRITRSSLFPSSCVYVVRLRLRASARPAASPPVPPVPGPGARRPPLANAAPC